MTTWETLGLLFVIFALGSIFLQLALSLFFQWGPFVSFNEVGRDVMGKAVYRFWWDTKPILALICSWLIVHHFGFDFFGGIMDGDGNGFTLFITALGYSGGSAFVHEYIKQAKETKEAIDAAKIRAIK